MDPSLNPWSSRLSALRSHLPDLPNPPSRNPINTIVVKTIAGKSYEIFELYGFFRVGCLKNILRHRIIPTPSMRRMSLIFENNVLDDTKMLWECNIGEGSELDLVMLAPPRISRSRSRAARQRARRRRSPSLKEGSTGRVYSLEVCREV